MERLIALVLPELVKAVPATLIAVVAAFSLLANAKALAKRFGAVEAKIEAHAAVVATVPPALERMKQHDIELDRLRQEHRDANLLASQWVNRAELVAGLSTTGEKAHKRIDEVEKAVVRLDERTKGRRRADG